MLHKVLKAFLTDALSFADDLVPVVLYLPFLRSLSLLLLSAILSLLPAGFNELEFQEQESE